MGKIFNALEKYRQERLLTRPVPKMRSADWEALLKYDRSSGKLNLNSSDVIEDPGTVQRLVANKMITPDGKLTPAGRQMSEEYRNRHGVSATGNDEQPTAQDNLLQKSTESVPPPKLRKSDFAALIHYDPETKNLLKYDTETCQLDESSKAILKEPDVIQRLIDNGMILPGGWLTSRGLQVIEKMELWKKEDRPENLDSLEFQREHQEEKKSFEIIEEAGRETKKIQPPASVSKVKKEQGEAVKSDDTSISENKTSMVPENKVIKGEFSFVEDPAASYRDEQIDKNLVSLSEPGSFESEQFKILRTNVFYPVSGKIPRSLAVTSAVPGDGKSFVAANLAISVANEIDKHVLLIDCDLRSPNIHRLFGFGDVPGLSDYLISGSPLTSLLLKSKVNKLTILPAGSPPPNPSELLSSERMSTLMAEVSDRYKDRLVILDSPPPTMTPEAGVLARFVDGVLLVVKYGRTTRDQVEDLIKRMGREKIIGSVINSVDMRSSRYGYRKYREQYYPAGINTRKK